MKYLTSEEFEQYMDRIGSAAQEALQTALDGIEKAADANLPPDREQFALMGSIASSLVGINLQMSAMMLMLSSIAHALAKDEVPHGSN